jgi:hypothetical protein
MYPAGCLYCVKALQESEHQLAVALAYSKNGGISLKLTML